MTQTTAPPTTAPPCDPVQAALANGGLRHELKQYAFAKLTRWFTGPQRDRREQEAEELIAETLKRAWEKRDSYDPT